MLVLDDRIVTEEEELLIDKFAGQAMQAMLASGQDVEVAYEVAYEAYSWAAAMILERRDFHKKHRDKEDVRVW